MRSRAYAEGFMRPRWRSHPVQKSAEKSREYAGGFSDSVGGAAPKGLGVRG
ncbi:MAG: hypothetical protein WBB28_21205 [Crinalium sp.]